MLKTDNDRDKKTIVKLINYNAQLKEELKTQSKPEADETEDEEHLNAYQLIIDQKEMITCLEKQIKTVSKSKEAFIKKYSLVTHN